MDVLTAVKERRAVKHFDPTQRAPSRASIQIDLERWLPEWTPPFLRNYLLSTMKQ